VSVVISHEIHGVDSRGIFDLCSSGDSRDRHYWCNDPDALSEILRKRCWSILQTPSAFASRAKAFMPRGERHLWCGSTVSERPIPATGDAKAAAKNRPFAMYSQTVGGSTQCIG
jgi:hypothetical protein